MRIVITTADRTWSDTQRHLLDQARGLVAAGHAVTVLAEEGGALLTRCGPAGIPAVAVPAFAAPSPRTLEIAARTLDGTGARIVWATGVPDALVMRRTLRHGGGERALVLAHHGAHPLGTADRLRGLLADVALVLAGSEEQRERQFAPLVTAGVLPEDRIEVVTTGVGQDFLDRLADADRTALRAELGVPDDDFLFLLLGALTWEDGVDRALDALDAMEAGPRSRTRVVVPGDGPLADELRDHATASRIGERVLFLDGRYAMADLVAAGDAAVLATTLPETGPLALKQAMAGGLPVVAAAQGGIPEFVEDERHGRLVVDDEDLRDALEHLVRDPAAARAQGEAARDDILAGHRLERRVEYLVHRLDLLALGELSLDAILPELTWDDVRLRSESDGGFVFVPRTSQLMELPSDTFPVVRDAVTAGDPASLLGPGPGAPRPLVRELYAMGALVRPRVTAAAT
ncbi:glycosyltransferase family 4 protein [Streptomyces sp. NPDC091377]|uniref:glycosyltransferase family 4 protein n=1 Tax=Streptomyces sp. NPDC091377 TaxID=3365995 RepID=UPI00381B9F8F